MVFVIPHGLTWATLASLVNGGMQNRTGFLFVVEYSISVSPSVGCKEKCHRKKFLAIGSRTVCVFCSVQLATPCEIALVFAVFHVHEFFCPFPDAVKFLFHVQLKAHHHPVGHAFRAGVIVSGVHKVSRLILRLVVNPLFLASVKKCLHC